MSLELREKELVEKDEQIADLTRKLAATKIVSVVKFNNNNNNQILTTPIFSMVASSFFCACWARSTRVS